jgi:hypothetical protein
MVVYDKNTGYLYHKNINNKIFLVKAKNEKKGIIFGSNFYFPSELIGKRVMLKVEIIDETKQINIFEERTKKLEEKYSNNFNHCLIEKCVNKNRIRGLCSSHYHSYIILKEQSKITEEEMMELKLLMPKKIKQLTNQLELLINTKRKKKNNNNSTRYKEREEKQKNEQ